jgi:RHS repeat-associated protein
MWTWENSEAFGNNAPNENPAALGAFTFNLRLLGQYFDQETGTHCNYYRNYDPTTGRYIESDPVGLIAGLNTYSYVSNNSLSRFDPNGLEEKCESCTASSGGIGPNSDFPIYDPPLENVYPEFLVLGGMTARSGAAALEAASAGAAAASATATATAQNIINQCKNVRCEFKKEGMHHFFPGYGWCEHYRLTCYRKGIKAPPFVSTQVRAPFGRCLPLKFNGGKP